MTIVDHDYLRAFSPTAGPELRELFARAADNAGLLATDFLTLRDLVELSDYADAEALQALLLLLLVALEEGSLCVSLSQPALEARLTDLIGAEAARAWAGRIALDLERADYSRLIGRDASDGKPVILVERDGKRFCYFQKYLHHELVFLEELRKRLADDRQQTSARLPTEVRQLLEDQPREFGVVLDPGQQTALGRALRKNFTIISGGPGTGKTAIVRALVRCLLRLGIAPERIALAAPTGRAAQRLTDALRGGKGEPPASAGGSPMPELTATTLHQLLAYSPTRGIFYRHAENPIPADVVIVDEASMIGLVLMAQLFQALRPDTKLVLLGDKDQLPSVEAGAVLAALVPADDLVVLLEKNYRSQPAIQEVAAAINAQQSEVVDRLPRCSLVGDGTEVTTLAELACRGGCWLHEQDGGSAELRTIVEHWAEHQFLSAEKGRKAYKDLIGAYSLPATFDRLEGAEEKVLDLLFQILGRSRLLTLIREGPWGCVDINRRLCDFLRPHFDRGARAPLFAGVPVLVTRNDYFRQLYNGDVGITLRCREGGYRVVFQRSTGYVAFPPETLPAHEPGFALTVHKSQGSEYDHVLLVLPPEGGRQLLTKELIYTGITRAKRLAIVYAKNEVLRHAVGRKITRESGLGSAVRTSDKPGAVPVERFAQRALWSR
jgi:exodeoxyribonuclease V alpha subunit